MSLKCPSCFSCHIWKDGLRKTSHGDVQRYICRGCGCRFSENGGFLHRTIYDTSSRGYSCQIGVQSHRRTKNLVQAEPLRNGLAGATEHTREYTEGKIVEFLWWMKKQGYKESTIRSRRARLKRLVNLKADLYNPENIKEVIATQDNWSDARKEAIVYAYDLFARCFGIKWNKPIYKPCRKDPFIPFEREIDDLIAAGNEYVATFLQLAKETAGRAGEIYNLEWTDIDFERKLVSITPEKGSNPRLQKISDKALGMINNITRDNQKVFRHYKNLQNLRRSFERARKRQAYKLGNPRLLRISFHTLRHWKATKLQHQTGDVYHVMQFLGHRNIKNTQMYIHLSEALYDNRNDGFICRVSNTPKKISELIEKGFEYVCDIDDLKFFRKRK